jgi:hypothetical protein
MVLDFNVNLHTKWLAKPEIHKLVENLKEINKGFYTYLN